ncbi:hypothetical protein FKW77_003104 [Venturia effusa]|uniref:HMG box domain-containing protein n=1 Tax=Venturia effusa TaxID=50376 RepID=A0A517LAN5_9PEZI|nr:hypothetical protein FKW77_003104 [Venturia effusa]
MNDLGVRLERLGLSQYLQSFISEGFDTWDTILDITESDLNALNVKLGHRRKLQRAIAESRGGPTERSLLHERKISLADGGYQSGDDSDGVTKESSGGRGTPVAPIQGSTTGTKRKYRRHPKADDNAPERPPSAYVIFSNMVREELRGQDLSFTEIAKLVGERWQVLAPDLRESCERQAAGAKEKYYAEMADYKKTAQYAQYQEYLADFKAKHAAPKHDGKRSRVEHENSVDTVGSAQNGERSDKLGEKPVGHGTPTESSTVRTPRSHSNAHAGATGFSALSGYHPVSASTSPATYSVDLRSPASQHAYSPGSSPRDGTSVYSSYDLPHHARGTEPAADLRGRQSNVPNHGLSNRECRYWSGPNEENQSQSPVHSDLLTRRAPRASPQLPALVRADTTHSSYSESLPGVPYQGTLLPVIDPQKADRMLPAPIPSTNGMNTSPLDARPPLPGAARALAQLQNHDHGSQWPALLRATELARDADLQDAADAKRERSTS